MAIDNGLHRAHCEEGPDGRWSGGCRMCGTAFSNEVRERAQAWVSGHDSAVVCARSVAEKIGPQFPKAGPGDAATVLELRDALEGLADDAEILQPMDQPPVLYLWTPPTEEGWHRQPIGALYLDLGCRFIPAADPDAVGSAVRHEDVADL